MSLFRKLFVPKEVRAALAIVDELACQFDCDAFRMIGEQAEKMVLARSQDFARAVRNGTPARHMVVGLINRIAGDYAESGEYHIWRGVLNPLGPGQDLLKIYDATADELVRLGVAEAAYAEEQKAALRQNIEASG